MSEDQPEKVVLEGKIVGEPEKRFWHVRTTIERGGFIVRCECGTRLSDGQFPPDVQSLMRKHVEERHST